MRTLAHPINFDEWRTLTRALLKAEIPPSTILWQSPGQADLFSELPALKPHAASIPSVPKAFLDLARTTACHRSGKQWPYLYAILWRLTHGERHLLSMATDSDVHPLRRMAKSIGRDIHKMHAFVRFRKVGEAPDSGREQFVAWFEPEHLILKLTESFFLKRFGGMNWSILTPDQCMHWDGRDIHYTKGVDQSHAPDSDSLEDLWRAYYRNIFNPARLKVKAMQSEMPKKYWKNLPEAELIEDLIAKSPEETKKMLERPASPEKLAPQNDYLEALRRLDDNP